jgi:hypothetical protein
MTTGKKENIEELLDSLEFMVKHMVVPDSTVTREGFANVMDILDRHNRTSYKTVISQKVLFPFRWPCDHAPMIAYCEETKEECFSTCRHCGSRIKWDEESKSYEYDPSLTPIGSVLLI